MKKRSRFVNTDTLRTKDAKPKVSLPPIHANLPRRKILLEDPVNEEKIPLCGEIISSKNVSHFSDLPEKTKATLIVPSSELQLCGQQ